MHRCLATSFEHCASWHGCRRACSQLRCTGGFARRLCRRSISPLSCLHIPEPWTRRRRPTRLWRPLLLVPRVPRRSRLICRLRLAAAGSINRGGASSCAICCDGRLRCPWPAACCPVRSRRRCWCVSSCGGPCWCLLRCSGRCWCLTARGVCGGTARHCSRITCQGISRGAIAPAEQRVQVARRPLLQLLRRGRRRRQLLLLWLLLVLLQLLHHRWRRRRRLPLLLRRRRRRRLLLLVLLLQLQLPILLYLLQQLLLLMLQLLLLLLLVLLFSLRWHCLCCSLLLWLLPLRLRLLRRRRLRPWLLPLCLRLACGDWQRLLPGGSALPGQQAKVLGVHGAETAVVGARPRAQWQLLESLRGGREAAECLVYMVLRRP